MSGYSANFTKDVRITGQNGSLADLDVCGNTTIGSELSVGGDVGIGTTTPSYKLDVNGDIRTKGNLFLDSVLSFNNGNSGEYNTSVSGEAVVKETALMYFEREFLGGKDYLVIEKTDSNSTPTDGGIAFTHRGKDQEISDVDMIIRNSRVGIGTTSPGYTLDVSGNARIGGDLFVDSDSFWLKSNDGNSKPRIRLLAHNNDNCYFDFEGISGGLISNSSGLRIRSDTTERMIITHGGHVGIGTMAPNSTLHVNGTANVSGNTTVGGTLGITGNTTMNNLDVDGTLDVSGTTTLNDINIQGNSTIAISSTPTDSEGFFLTVLNDGTVKRSAIALSVLKANATSGSSSSDEVTNIIENIQIVSPNGALLDNSMSTFVDINSGGTTIGGGLSVGGEFNGRRYFNFLDGSSNTDSSEYITDHYLSSDSNLNMVFGAKVNSGSPHLSNPKFTINSIASGGSYNEVFHLTDSDMSINLYPSSGSRVSVFEATGSLVKFGANTEINGTCTATTFSGDLTGTADQADLVKTSTNSDDSTAYLLFVGDNTTTYQEPKRDADLTYNTSTNTLTVPNITSSGSLDFGSSYRQMLNLYGTTYGIGVQTNTTYFRSTNNFAWYKGGSHNNSSLDSGGGTTLMKLDNSGKLTLNNHLVLEGVGTYEGGEIELKLATGSGNASGGYMKLDSYYSSSYGDVLRLFGNTGSVEDRKFGFASGSKFGIGTYYPQYHLDVDGTAYADQLFIGSKPASSGYELRVEGSSYMSSTLTVVGNITAPTFTGKATKLNLSAAGFVKTTNQGVLSVDTNTYQTSIGTSTDLTPRHITCNGKNETVAGTSTHSFMMFKRSGANDYVYFRDIATGSDDVIFCMDFHDNTNDADFRIREWNSSGGSTSPTTCLRVQRTLTEVNYDLTVGGTCEASDFNATSDMRLKENIIPLEGSLEKVLQLEGKQYNWIKDDEKKLKSGLIAQEVEKIIPEVVHTKPITNDEKSNDEKSNDENEVDKKGMKSINYNGLVPYLVECIKELKSEIEDLKSEIEDLKRKR